jgi:hypothetical protein
MLRKARQTLATALFGGCVVILVIFGISFATNNVERVNGPIEGAEPKTLDSSLPADLFTQQDAPTGRAPAVYNANEYTILYDINGKPVLVPNNVLNGETAAEPNGNGASLGAKSPYGPEFDAARLPGLPDTTEDTRVNQLADGTAGILQTVSSKGVRALADLFAMVTH